MDLHVPLSFDSTNLYGTKWKIRSPYFMRVRRCLGVIAAQGKSMAIDQQERKLESDHFVNQSKKC